MVGPLGYSANRRRINSEPIRNAWSNIIAASGTATAAQESTRPAVIKTLRTNTKTQIIWNSVGFPSTARAGSTASVHQKKMCIGEKAITRNSVALATARVNVADRRINRMKIKPIPRLISDGRITNVSPDGNSPPPFRLR